jgi:hypothetical protein
VTDIFISYTSSDRDWAFRRAEALEAMAHLSSGSPESAP